MFEMWEGLWPIAFVIVDSYSPIEKAVCGRHQWQFMCRQPTSTQGHSAICAGDGSQWLYIWVINNFIAYYRTSNIRVLRVSMAMLKTRITNWCIIEVFDCIPYAALFSKASIWICSHHIPVAGQLQFTQIPKSLIYSWTAAFFYEVCLLCGSANDNSSHSTPNAQNVWMNFNHNAVICLKLYREIDMETNTNNFQSITSSSLLFHTEIVYLEIDTNINIA